MNGQGSHPHHSNRTAPRPPLPTPHSPLSTPHSSLTTAVCLLLCLFAPGCGREIDTIYGRRQGPAAGTSVNGTAVLARMFQEAGHTVFSRGLLSPKLHRRADCIVWFPDDFKPPAEEVRTWLEWWLEEEPGRTLIYVGRDFDAGWWYWRKIEPDASPDQLPRIRERKSAAQLEFLAERSQIPDWEDCGWFAVEGRRRPREVRSLGGDPEWLAGIDPARLEIELAGRVLPSPYADLLLESEGDMLVSIEPWNESQAIVVANGSFLLNLPLVNHEHRKLAGKLVRAVGPPRKTVVFLESGAGGPSVYDRDPTARSPTGLEIFHIWPTNWILLHLAVAGIIFCFARYPIFGRPRPLGPEGTSDFGEHVRALGELFQRSRDRDYATARLSHYQQNVRDQRSRPHDGETSTTRAPTQPD